MDESQSVSKYWIFFFISSIVLILMLVFVREYFWTVLPFVFTAFGKAMRII